jgi:hypothetical protein
LEERKRVDTEKYLVVAKFLLKEDGKNCCDESALTVPSNPSDSMKTADSESCAVINSSERMNAAESLNSSDLLKDFDRVNMVVAGFL